MEHATCAGGSRRNQAALRAPGRANTRVASRTDWRYSSGPMLWQREPETQQAGAPRVLSLHAHKASAQPSTGAQPSSLVVVGGVAKSSAAPSGPRRGPSTVGAAALGAVELAVCSQKPHWPWSLSMLWKKLPATQQPGAVPETTCDFYPNNPNNPSKMAIIRPKTADSRG